MQNTFPPSRQPPTQYFSNIARRAQAAANNSAGWIKASYQAEADGAAWRAELSARLDKALADLARRLRAA